MTDLSELKRLAEAASDGPWEALVDKTRDEVIVADEYAHIGQVHSVANGEFIAACDPQTVLKLVAVIEAAKRFAGGNPQHGIHEAIAQLEKSDRG